MSFLQLTESHQLSAHNEISFRNGKVLLDKVGGRRAKKKCLGLDVPSDQAKDRIIRRQAVICLSDTDCVINIIKTIGSISILNFLCHHRREDTKDFNTRFYGLLIFLYINTTIFVEKEHADSS